MSCNFKEGRYRVDLAFENVKRVNIGGSPWSKNEILQLRNHNKNENLGEENQRERRAEEGSNVDICSICRCNSCMFFTINPDGARCETVDVPCAVWPSRWLPLN